MISELGDTILNTLRFIRERCEKLPDSRRMIDKVCPALEYMLALLRKMQKSPVDVEVVTFCASLTRFQRYLRITRSDRSTIQLARSRKVAESHRLVYSDFDRLLDALGVLDSDPIRAWGQEKSRRSTGARAVNVAESSSYKSTLTMASNDTNAVVLHHFDSPASTHHLWTQAGLSSSSAATLPAWFLALKDLTFSESDAISIGSFGTVYKGMRLDTPAVVKFMGYEEDMWTISTDLFLHEVRVCHRFNHLCVLKLYGACHLDKRYFLCELASNRDLRTYA